MLALYQLLSYYPSFLIVLYAVLMTAQQIDQRDRFGPLRSRMDQYITQFKSWLRRSKAD